MPIFYVFHGDDQLNVDEAVKKLRATMGEGTEADMNISEFDGTIATVPEIINAVASYPFLSEYRMVIVRGMLTWITRKGAGQAGKNALTRLEEDLPNLPPYARLIFAEYGALGEKHAIVQLAKAHQEGYARLFETPKDKTGWIIKRAKDEYGAQIDGRAAQALAAVIGDDLRVADNELIKLVSYAGEGRPITEADVEALTPYLPEANIFKMTDALADGRGDVALDLLHQLMRDKKQDAFGLFGMVVRQFRFLLLAREYLDKGGAGGELANVLHVKPFVAQNVAKQARAFTLEDLEAIYRSLQEADVKMKTGQIDPDLALDVFVARVAKEK